MKKSSPVKQVEAYLHNLRNSYGSADRPFLPSANTIISRLFADRLNMSGVYEELLNKYEKNEYWRPVMRAIIETAAGWNPEKIKNIRDDMRLINGGDGIQGLNRTIEEKAAELAKLLRDRDAICKRSNLYRPDVYHPLDLIEPATKIAGAHTHSLYTNYPKKPLEEIFRREFKALNYWPGIADILDALAQMQRKKSTPIDELDAVALKVRQAHIRDFWRVLDVSILRLYDSTFPFRNPELPMLLSKLDSLKVMPWLSDKSIADTTNCVLGLDAKIEDKHVKSYRTAERRRQR